MGLASTRSFNVNIGTATDSNAPVVSSVSPMDRAEEVGVNAELRVRFNEPINPLTVDGGTIVLSNGISGLLLACTISFADQDRTVTIVPHAPLPASTRHTVSINGVTDRAGNPVVPLTTSFQTGAGPDVVEPRVTRSSPSGSSEPVNSIVVVEFSEPIDPATITSNSVRLINQTSGSEVTGSRSVEPGGRRVFFMPTASLAVGTQYQLQVTPEVQDVAGNGLSSYFYLYFTTGSGSDVTPPTVVGTHPTATDTSVPVNGVVAVQMSETVDPTSVNTATVQLRQGTNAVVATLSLEDGNRRIRLVPTSGLIAQAPHTLRIEGVRDVAGCPLSSAFGDSGAARSGASQRGDRPD
jgi:hypothetical protein